MKRLATLLAVMSGTLGACGDDEPDKAAPPKPNGIARMSAPKALEAADKAMSTLKDVTYVGTFPAFGRAPGELEGVGALVSSGNCQVTLRGDDFGELAIRVVGDRMFFKGDDKVGRKLFGLDQERADRLADRWLGEFPADPDVREDCKPADLVPGAPFRAKFEAGETTTLDDDPDGGPVRAFEGRDEDGPLTLWIATTGEPRVLRAEGRDEEGRWELTATMFDQGLELAAPDDAVELAACVRRIELCR